MSFRASWETDYAAAAELLFERELNAVGSARQPRFIGEMSRIQVGTTLYWWEWNPKHTRIPIPVTYAKELREYAKDGTYFRAALAMSKSDFIEVNFSLWKEAKEGRPILYYYAVDEPSRK